MLGGVGEVRHARRAMGLATAIRDFFTHPVEAESQSIAKADDVPKMPPTPATAPVGAAGLSVYSGYVTSTERSADLTGETRYRKFAEWPRLVAALGAALRSFLILSGGPSWTVKPYKADDADAPTPEDEARAAWASRALHGMATEWPRHVMRGVLAYAEGAAIGVWTAKRAPDGAMTLDDITWLPLGTIQRWDLDPQGRILGVIQTDPQTAAEIPIARERLIIVRDIPTTAHPAGDGALRFVAEAVRQLLALEQLLLVGYERDVNGIPVVHAPIDEAKAMIGAPKPGGGVYTAADVAASLQPVHDFLDASKRKNAGLAFDSSTFKDREGNPTSVRRYDAKVLTASATSHAEIAQRVNDLCWYILAALGFEYLAMGRGSGTQAMHVSKSENAVRVVSSALSTFASAGRRDILRPLWILNGWDPANPTDPQNLPTLEWDALELSDVASVVNAIAQALSAGGVEPGRADDVIDAVLANMGLPRLRPMDDPAVLGAREAAAAAVRPQPIDPEEPPEVAPEDEPMPPEED